MIAKYNNSEAPKPKVPGPRKGEGKMSDDELQTIMSGLVSDAVKLVDEELGPKRAEATDYYFGRPFGNEESGRSQFVITEVRDSVHGILPSLLRVFFGAERAVEFVPRTQAGVGQARQATDYVQYVFAEDNKGFLRTLDVLKDGLIRRLGIFKWWWDAETHRAYREENLTEQDLQQLVSRPSVTPTQVTPQEPAEGMPELFTIDYTVTIEGKPCVAAVPPEEFLFSREARDFDEALMVAHRTELTRGELLAMGIPEDILDTYGKEDNALRDNLERVERTAEVNVSQGDDPDAGTANDKILYIEAYPFLDLDGNGDRELCKVCLIGPGYHVALPPEPVDERPFSFFCPIPEPHTVMGQGTSDLTMDLQRVKSSLVRAMNDSLALSIYPRTAFLEGFVSVEDLLNTEIGATIRTSKENAVQSINHPFTGEKAMPILEFFEGVTESRIGKGKGSMGLDADALQSSTLEGVTAALAASQEQMELMARIFAEQALKPLFRGLYRMIVKYRPAARLVKLRGEYVTIDVSAWEADMDVSVNVALGTSSTLKKMMLLKEAASEQKELLSMLGLSNPVVSLAQLRNTYARLLELGGEKDAREFFNELPPGWQPPPSPPQPTPEQLLAETQLQIEQIRTTKDLEIKQAELRLKEQQQAFEQQLKLKQMAMDFTLRRYQIDAQFKANFTQAQLEADAAAEEAALEGALNIAAHQRQVVNEDREHSLAVQSQAHDQALERDQQAHEQELAAAAASQAGESE